MKPASISKQRQMTDSTGGKHACCKDKMNARNSKKLKRRKRTNSFLEKPHVSHFQSRAIDCFPHWQQGLLVIPSIFRHDAEGIPTSTNNTGGQAALKGSKKEKDFLHLFQEFQVKRPTIAFHSLKFKELLNNYNKLMREHTPKGKHKHRQHHQLYPTEAFKRARHYVPSMKENSQEAEVDFVMFVKSKGVFLFEVKSSVGERLHAKEQLGIRKALMYIIITDAIEEGLLGQWDYNDIPMYACAVFPTSERPELVYPDEYYRDSFSNEEQWTRWWNTLIESKPTVDEAREELLHNVVARFVYTTTQYMPLTVNEGVAEVGDDLLRQKVLKTTGSMPKLIYDTDSHGNTKATKLTNKQLSIVNGPKRQIIHGPPGSGKTVIMAIKVLQLASQGKNILVVCGFDCEGLKYWYENILRLNQHYGQNHLEYVYLCTMKELILQKDCDIIENYCFVDEVNEILDARCPLREFPEYKEIWQNLCAKHFLWIATDKILSQSVFNDDKNDDSLILPSYTSNLKSILRNTVNIYKEYATHLTSSEEVLIDVGHDIQGLGVEAIHITNSSLASSVLNTVLKLSEKRTHDHDAPLETILYKDILIYLSSDAFSYKNTHGEELSMNDTLRELIQVLQNSNVPLKCTRDLSGNNPYGFGTPTSDSVTLAWHENDILSLEFIVVISCEMGVKAGPTVLSRAVSQLIRVYCDM